MMIFTAKNDKTKGFSTTHPRLGIFLANSESSRRPCQKNSYRMNPLQIPEFHDLLLRSWTATSHKHVDFSENLRKHHGTLQKNHGLSWFSLPQIDIIWIYPCWSKMASTSTPEKEATPRALECTGILLSASHGASKWNMKITRWTGNLKNYVKVPCSAIFSISSVTNLPLHHFRSIENGWVHQC